MSIKIFENFRGGGPGREQNAKVRKGSVFMTGVREIVICAADKNLDGPLKNFAHDNPLP